MKEDKNMSQFDWFKKVFINQASDFTIAQIMFLYQKFGKDKEDLEKDEVEFIEDMLKLWKSKKIGEK